MDHPEQPGPRQPSEDWLRGDFSLLDEQLRQLWRQLHEICRRLVRPRTALGITEEDLLHDVLSELLRYDRSLVPASPNEFLRYFNVAARRTLMDHVRRRDVRGRHSRSASLERSQLESSLASSRAQDPGANLTMADEVEWALSWLGRKSSPRMVRMFRRFLDGLSVREIASLERISQKAVEQSLSRARSRLRAAAKLRS